MSEEIDPQDVAAALARIRAQAAAGEVRVSGHAQDEMDAESIAIDEVLEAIAVGRILENYPTYHKGPCCLLYGDTRDGRALHIVCSTARPRLVIITAYLPLPPRWVTPTQRGWR